MTKAEATIELTRPKVGPFWLRMESIKQDYKSCADCPANVYHLRTFVDGNSVPQDTHRLVCYSHWGDSILWEWNADENKWKLFDCRFLPYGANNEGNIESAYDSPEVLAVLKPSEV